MLLSTALFGGAIGTGLMYISLLAQGIPDGTSGILAAALGYSGAAVAYIASWLFTKIGE